MIERFKERLPLVRPMLIPLLVYLGLLTFATSFLDAYPTTPWRYLVALLPMLPGFFLAAGMLSAIRRLDELSRKVIYESLAVAFGATLFLTLALGLLSLAGVAYPNPMYIGLFMAVVWLAAKLIISRRYE